MESWEKMKGWKRRRDRAEGELWKGSYGENEVCNYKLGREKREDGKAAGKERMEEKKRQGGGRDVERKGSYEENEGCK